MTRFGEEKMANYYDKYFSKNDISSSKAKLMYDIKNHVLYGDALFEIINDLEKHGLLTEKYFTKEERHKWNGDYARFLAGGFASGYFSRDYLLYLAEVAEYLYQKKRRIKILRMCGIVVLLVAGFIIAFCRS
jgi:hypothetical protein